jgi:hypothetical protein
MNADYPYINDNQSPQLHPRRGFKATLKRLKPEQWVWWAGSRWYAHKMAKALGIRVLTRKYPWGEGIEVWRLQ